MDATAEAGELALQEREEMTLNGCWSFRGRFIEGDFN